MSYPQPPAPTFPTFRVTVKTGASVLRFVSTGTDSATVHIATVERFGACGVTVQPA